MNEDFLNPEKLCILAKKIYATEEIEKLDATLGFGIEGELLSSALSALYKVPSLNSEIIERNQIAVIPTAIKICVIIHEIKKLDNVFETIKKTRKKGIKIEKVIATSKIPIETETELRALGLDLIMV